MTLSAAKPTYLKPLNIVSFPNPTIPLKSLVNLALVPHIRVTFH